MAEGCPEMSFNHQKIWKYGKLLRTNLQQTKKTANINLLNNTIKVVQQNKILTRTARNTVTMIRNWRSR
jgi:hypothetical protein